VPAVEEVTFNGPLALEKGQDVLYVTDRCVFRLTRNGPELIEIAPGIDLDRDIRAQVEFDLIVSPDLKEMSADIFASGPMRLSMTLEEK
jgi:acyl CoA:acetate/3-ketoacid CoA transferase